MESLAELITSVYDMLPVAQEFYLFCFFLLGFVLFRTEALRSLFRRSAKPKGKSLGASFETFGLHSLERLHDDFSHRRYEQVLEGWAYLEKYTAEALSSVVLSLMALGRPDDVGLFIAKAASNLSQLRANLHIVVAAAANPPSEVRRQHVTPALRDIYDQARDSLDELAQKELLLALAHANDEQRVAGLFGSLAERKAPICADLLSKVVRGFLACKNLDAALGYLQRVMAAPSATGLHELIIAVVRASTEAAITDDVVTGACRPRAWDVLDALKGVEVPNEALAILLEWCARQTPVDVALATRLEGLLRESAGAKPLGAYDALVRVHASSSGHQTKAFKCFDELVELAAGTGPSEGSLVGMISSCVEAHNASLAEYILSWARAQGRCTLPIFSVTLKVLAAAKQAERMCEIYEAARNDGFALDDVAYGQLINFAVQAGRLDLARSLFQRAKNPDAQNYMSLIRACGKEGKVEQALEMLEEVRQTGEADTVTYNCALDVCVSCGNEVAADAVFKEMKATGKVDVVSYNILLKRCLSDDKSPRAAEAVLEEMKERGLRPNIATYNSLLSQNLAAGDFSRAWRTVEQMENSGQSPDAYTISILFKGYKRERRTMDALSIDRALALVEKHSVKVDEVLVNIALEACVALRDLTRLKNAFDIFKRSGWAIPKQCAMHTYGVLIKAHGQSQNISEAWRLWEEVTVEKGLEASEQLYGQMLDALVGNGQLDDALVLFEEMKVAHRDSLNSQGFAVAYAMIIRGFAQRKECARALKCYQEMKMHGTKVSLVVLNTLIDACSRVSDMGTASKLHEEMVDMNVLPDLITYSTLIKGFSVCGELDKALQLFTTMRNKGIRPDAIVFNSLLDGCARKQMPALCEQVVADMETAGVVPSNHSASIMIKLYGRCKDLDAAFKVIDEMPKKFGFQANNAVYTCLMSACIANGRLEQAMELRTRMLKEGVYPDEKTYSTLLRGALRANSVELCVLLVNAALDQGASRNSARYLLDDELVKSVLLLIQRRHLWEAHGRELHERLRSAGVRTSCPADGPKVHSGNRHEAHAAKRDGAEQGERSVRSSDRSFNRRDSQSNCDSRSHQQQRRRVPTTRANNM
jgi:pentatricopeptide repeat protein